MFVVMLFTVISFSTVKAQSTNDEALIGKARGAAHECLQPYLGSFYSIGSSVEVSGICFVEGFLYRVTFYAGPNCSGPNPCPSFVTRIIATVDLDCGGNVFGVNCGLATQ